MGEPTDGEKARGDEGIVPRDLPARILNNLLEGVQLVGRDYRYLYVNEAVVAQGRTTRAALLGRTMMECYPGIDRTDMFAQLRQCMEERRPGTMENLFAYPDGTTGWFELRFEPVPEGVAILSVNITERKRAEASLRKTMRALRTLSRCNQTLVRATDESQFLDDVCRLVVEAGEYASAWIELDPEDGGVRREVARAEAGGTGSRAAVGEPLTFDLRVRGQVVGTLSICTTASDPFGRVERDLLEEVALDLSHGIETLRARVDHARTEQQLLVAQRLEAVGRLAGGVAHDFNNLLSAIMAHGEFALDGLGEQDPARREVEQIGRAAGRAANLTRQLLAFGRKQVMQPRVLDLNAVVEDLEPMMRRLLGEDLDIAIHPGDDLEPVFADPGQLEQVLMNLVVNARDAMPEGGKLTIETRNVDLDEDYAATHLSVKPGPHVMLSVADTGEGMSESVRRQIFDPFFTTKDRTKGTGLGLAMVYGIVKQSGGNIWVYSEPGQGTTFKIYLPRVEREPEDNARPGSPDPSAATSAGEETILLAEDNSMVREVTTRILTRAGYRLLAAPDGQAALALAGEHEGRIDLLLTDVIMPNLGGQGLAERIQALHPEVKVLFMSGHTDNAVVHQEIVDTATATATAFIGKPFSRAELTRKVRTLLDTE